ncbi:Os03g0319000 [Oryza sativa Japonica Group]|uniref:Os03g0319000 protein n=1 Tax=Oryza sativa subsp. japonica TaxID=39947 RepID=Q0DSC8_ORYSJ|nr:Os03g0319000 [Oryza sativa Japonica Group]|eukprot:NP_001049946.1 Os03g0319000 [Oryza sativa Japonica Group]
MPPVVAPPASWPRRRPCRSRACTTMGACYTVKTTGRLVASYIDRSSVSFYMPHHHGYEYIYRIYTAFCCACTLASALVIGSIILYFPCTIILICC